jgi:LppP/LprE lipoprotein
MAVVKAGWTLFGTYQSGWGVRVVGGQAGVDGMCRPMDYQYFVFVNGKFAGTSSPITMASRADGSGGPPMLSNGGTQLDATFARYTASDALCCPSSSTYVTYQITNSGGLPLLVPTNASTSPNS